MVWTTSPAPFTFIVPEGTFRFTPKCKLKQPPGITQKRERSCAPIQFDCHHSLEEIVFRPRWRSTDNLLHYAGEVKRSPIIGRTRVRQHGVGIASGQHLQERNRTVYVPVMPLWKPPAKTIVRIVAV